MQDYEGDKVYRGDWAERKNYVTATPPMPMGEIIPKMPKLKFDRDFTFIHMISRGNVGLFHPRNLPYGYRLGDILRADFFGDPHANKTSSLNIIEDMLNALGIASFIRRETHISALPVRRDKPAINSLRAMHSVARLFEDVELQQQGVPSAQEPNVHIHEQGPLASLAFEEAYQQLGWGIYDPPVRTIIAPSIKVLNIGVIVGIPDHEATARGSRMTSRLLKALHRAHSHMPYLLLPLSDAAKQPMVVFDINGQSRGPEDIADQVVRSIGSLWEAAWRPTRR